MSKDEIFAWFPEPAIDDPTYAKYCEHISVWLARSTVSRAVEYRKSLNYHLSKMPQKARENFLNSAKKHWRSSIFELLVARFLQELGAELVIEEPIDTGKKPDFLANFTDGTIIVEATAPVFDDEIAEKIKKRNPLLAIIELKIPPGWNIGVCKLPNIGLAESKKEFKKVITEMISEAEVSENENQLTIKKELQSGEIILKFSRSKSGNGKISWEPVYALFDKSESRIRLAGKKKKKQVRQSKYPVVLAIHASGIASEYEDFNSALFGYSFDIFGPDLIKIGNDFRRDGFFLKRKRVSPTCAGVLAFVNVDILYGDDPILYKNPNYSENLPSAIESLEQRCFDLDSKSIYSIPAKNRKIMDKLRKDALESPDPIQ